MDGFDFPGLALKLAAAAGLAQFDAVELRHLKHFVAVADAGGISAAARNLGLTQPALSRQIKALEDDLGVVLLDRGQYPDYWSRVTAYFKEHSIQAKVAGEFDGIASLAAAVEANLGCAIIAQTTRLTGEGGSRIVTRPLDPQPQAIVVAAGVAARHAAPDHVRAFIGEMMLQVSA